MRCLLVLLFLCLPAHSLVLFKGSVPVCAERVLREEGIEKAAKGRIVAAIKASGGLETDNEGYSEVFELEELPGAFVLIAYRQLKLNELFTRMSIYAEGDGDIKAGTVVPHLSTIHPSDTNATIRFDHELVKGWNIPGKAMREFFEGTLQRCAAGQPQFCLNIYEREFYEAVYKPVLSQRDRFYVIGYSLQTVGSTLSTTSHELRHVQYAFDPQLQAIVREYWTSEVTEDHKQAMEDVLFEMGYNIRGNEPFMIDEFQAYMLQQDAATLSRFKKWVPLYAAGLRERIEMAGIKLIEL